MFEQIHYTVEFKLRVIGRTKECMNLSKVSIEFNVDRKCIRRWLEKEDEYIALDKGRMRIYDGGRHLISTELEDLLLERVSDYRLEKQGVNRNMIVHWAEEFCNQNDINNLCSHGWLIRALLAIRPIQKIIDQLFKKS